MRARLAPGPCRGWRGRAPAAVRGPDDIRVEHCDQTLEIAIADRARKCSHGATVLVVDGQGGRRVTANDKNCRASPLGLSTAISPMQMSRPRSAGPLLVDEEEVNRSTSRLGASPNVRVPRPCALASRCVLMDELDIGIADPRTDDVGQLIEHHLAFGRANSPPQDAHALEVDGLLDPAIVLFGIRSRGELLAIGALKRLDDQHAEVKTMHTVEQARGRGIGRAMLDHLLAVARARGFERVSLETGSMDAFAPARSLYASAGFAPCEPFGDYRQSPNSSYMTISL